MLGKRSHTAHDFELNLTPIIDCFVTLICFLLLSTTYVSLVGLDAKVPVAVPASSAAAQKEPTFKLELVAKPKALELRVTGAGGASGKKMIPSLPTAVNGSNYDLAALHTELIKVKRERPKEFSVFFTSETEMPYEELVRLMDTTRNLEAKDGDFTFTDERNGQPTKVDLLFPDFVIANLGTADRR